MRPKVSSRAKQMTLSIVFLIGMVLGLHLMGVGATAVWFAVLALLLPVLTVLVAVAHQSHWLERLTEIAKGFIDLCLDAGHEIERRPLHAPQEQEPEREEDAESDDDPGVRFRRFSEKVLRSRHSGDRRFVTVLFADIVAFAPLVERLTPTEVVTLLNELFALLMEIVLRHDGTPERFVGDRVMAFWGAPEVQAEQAALAIDAAEDMMRWLEVLNMGWHVRFGVKIELAIGVHTGEAIVGHLGAEERMTYSAIGDTVNLAGWLESIARPQQILISGSTRSSAGEGSDFIDLGEKRVFGKGATLRLFEVRP